MTGQLAQLGAWGVLESATSWRIAAAILAALILFTITAALHQYGRELEPSWRLVLRAVSVQQAVLTYVAIARARATPRGLPVVVDTPLVALVLSAVALLVCVVGVFAGRREGPRQ